MRKTKLYIFVILLILIPKTSFGLIEVDITRGNLNPLPIAVSPLFVETKSIKEFQNLLKKTGLVVSDFDVIESNEAFAAQAIAVNRGLNLDPTIVNPNGGAIALGHPVGATGAIITLKALYQLDNINGKRALMTMCIGGGQGIALAIEKV